MRTGELARRSQVNLQTIRYYERRGLLAPESRGDNGYRRYGADALRRVRFIKRAQALGFSLEEASELLALDRGGRGFSQPVRRLAEDKLAQVEDKIAELERVRRSLTDLVTDCRERCNDTRCPILDALGSEAEA